MRPSLSQDVVPSPGKLRITVTYASEGAASAEKQRHRITSSTSAADMQPPEGVLSLSLDSVLLFADILELPERKKVATSKRLKVSADKGCVPQPTSTGAVDDLELKVSDELPPTSPATSKRARTLALPDAETGSSSPAMGLDNSDLEKLIDGALRVSILSRINNKMSPGVKLKANTFESGLADIAPVLWKPGYLSVGRESRTHAVDRANLTSVAVTERELGIYH